MYSPILPMTYILGSRSRSIAVQPRWLGTISLQGKPVTGQTSIILYFRMAKYVKLVILKWNFQGQGQDGKKCKKHILEYI
jgi:hypothetical protein